MTCSALAGKGLAAAKEGNTLGPIAMSLFYATDFADRLENEIIPALRAGFVVLTDRYIYSLMARAPSAARNRSGSKASTSSRSSRTSSSTSAQTSSELVTARCPDHRVQLLGMRNGPAPRRRHVSTVFIEYQGRLLRIFDAMSSEYRFHVVETIAPIQDVCDEMKNHLEPLFASGVPA